MEAEVFLDTHVIVWIGNGELVRFNKETIDFLENSVLLISPISLLEIDYLHEMGRVAKSGILFFEDFNEKTELLLSEDPFKDIVKEASRLRWTRDPFDRLIVAHTILHKATLVTKDKRIRKHYSKALW